MIFILVCVILCLVIFSPTILSGRMSNQERKYESQKMTEKRRKNGMW